MDEKMKMMHRDIFLFLLDQRDENGPLLFKPRLRDYRGRLSNGYWFLGNDDYIHVSFWNGEDSDRKIHNIAFVVKKNGKSYIELSGKRQPELSDLFQNIMTSIGGKWKDPRGDNDLWRLHYTGGGYLKNLEEFVRNKKPIIDDLLRNEGDIGIEFLTMDYYRKYVRDRIVDGHMKELEPEFDDVFEKTGRKGTNTKSTKKGRRSAQDTATIKKRHNRLQHILKDALEKNSHYDSRTVVLEQNHMDVRAKTKTGALHFFEVKVDAPLYCIREGVGQILEYSYYHDDEEEGPSKLIIVGPSNPNASTKEYLKTLRNKFSLPVWYASKKDIDPKDGSFSLY